MSDENREEFDDMLNSLNEEHQPDGTTELLLVYKRPWLFSIVGVPTYS